MEREEFLERYRHSIAHVLAKAMIELYGEEVQYAIGPQIEDGAYYDFWYRRACLKRIFPLLKTRCGKSLREERTGREKSLAERML